MKKVLLSGYFGFDNSGDDAILKAMVDDFRKFNTHIEIKALSKNPVKTEKTYGIQAADRFNIHEIMKSLKETDLFISGGGSLLQDITSTRSLMYYLFLIFLAKIFRKKVYVYANGIGPIDKGFNRFITKIILEKVDFISLRDKFSYEFVRDLKVKNKNIKVTADPVFSLKPISKEVAIRLLAEENLKVGDKTIGICIREWKKAPDLKEKLAKACDELAEMGWDVLFVPFHLPKDHIYSMEIAKLCKHKDKIKTITKTYNAEELMGIFGLLKVLLAMRLHSLIYASGANLPMVGLIYDPKVKAMINELGIVEYVNVENFTSQELIKQVAKAIDNIDERKIVLEKNTDKMKKKAKENIEIALKLL